MSENNQRSEKRKKRSEKAGICVAFIPFSQFYAKLPSINEYKVVIRNSANHVKIMGITPNDPRKLILTSTQSFSCHYPYKWKRYHFISLLWYFEQCMAIFSGDIFLTFLDLTFSRQIPFLVFERVSTNMINLVSFWALRFRKIESRFGPFVSSLMTPFGFEESLLTIINLCSTGGGGYSLIRGI